MSRFSHYQVMTLNETRWLLKTEWKSTRYSRRYGHKRDEKLPHVRQRYETGDAFATSATSTTFATAATFWHDFVTEQRFHDLIAHWMLPCMLTAALQCLTVQGPVGPNFGPMGPC